VALVLKNQPDSLYVLIGKEFACKVFASHDLSFVRYSGSQQEDLNSYLDDIQKLIPAEAVLTSASSIPEQDMTEKYMWQWASIRKVPSIAILDQWQNYKERFSGPYGEKINGYLPDVICVMDESARSGMIRDGIPENRIIITGHPSLSRLRRMMTKVDAGEIEAIRRTLKLEDNQKIISFISEPFTSSYGDKIGYTELSILKELLVYFKSRDALFDGKHRMKLVIKKHPKDSPDAFHELELEFPQSWKVLAPVFITDEIDKVPLLQASDLVVGMASIMLMESVALGRPTISIQVGAKLMDLCEAVNQGIIPFISTRTEMSQLLDRLLNDPSYRESYAEGIKNYPVMEDADKRIWKIVDSRKRR